MKKAFSSIKDHPYASYVNLLIAGLLLLVYNGKTVVPFAAWLWPVFFLRFIRKRSYPEGILAGGLVTAATMIITTRGFIPLEGLPFYLTAAAMGSALLLPFLADKFATGRVKGFASTLALPLSWTVLEFANVVAGPFGSFGSLAYTQYENLPLVQLVSVTGIWGIVFLVAWFASIANRVWDHDFDLRKTGKGAVLYALLLTVILFSGSIALVFFSPSAYPLRVAAVSVPNGFHEKLDGTDLRVSFAKDPDNALNMLLDMAEELPPYLFGRTEAEADAGAALVVWSEGAVPIRSEEKDGFIARCGEVARAKNIHLLATLVSYPPDFPASMPVNMNVLLNPSGEPEYEYRKSVLVPGEMGVPGDGILRIAETGYGRIGSAICYDMDFPQIIRAAGRNRADILLVPSSDWREIDPIHTRMAAYRAVENGFSVVRATSRGLSATIDYQGRMTAVADYFKTGDVSMAGFLPVRGIGTVYSVMGDWFAVLAILGLAAMAAVITYVAVRQSRHEKVKP